MKLARIVAVGILASCSSVLAATQSPSPEELVRQMSSALQNLNYEGHFVLVQNGEVEAMQILHRGGDEPEGELERMLSQNGEAREVYRNRSSVTCIWPNSNAVIVSDAKSRKTLPKVDASLANNLHYNITLGDDDRVAGISSYVVNIRPRDQFRYGHRFWIDKQTHMLLRSTLLDEDGDVIEQIMFTNISYPETIDLNRFDIPIAHREIQPHAANALMTEDIEPKSLGVNQVDFSSLPSGYVEISETYQPQPINDGPISHVMVSDGVASVSVYVEYVESDIRNDIGLGASTMGGINAYMQGLPEAIVTAVGEVPAETVKAIAMAVQLVK